MRIRINFRAVERSLGVLAIVLGITGTGMSIYTQVHDEHQVSCQAQINQEFLSVLKQRATISNGQTQTIDDLIVGIFAAKTKVEAQADYQKYLTELAGNSDKLRKLTYPDLSSC